MQFAQTVFQAPQVGLVFGRFSLGPPYAKSTKMADLGGFAKFAITRLCGQFWSRRCRRKCCPMFALQVHTNEDIMHFAQTVFQAPQVGLVFGRFSLGPPYAKSPKMADLGGFAKFAITRLCGQFWSRRLRGNVVRCLRFKRILMKISCNLRRLFFRPLKSALFLGGFPLVPPMQNLRKWPIWVALPNLP